MVYGKFKVIMVTGSVKLCVVVLRSDAVQNRQQPAAIQS
jgi:hypothetical protein